MGAPITGILFNIIGFLFRFPRRWWGRMHRRRYNQKIRLYHQAKGVHLPGWAQDPRWFPRSLPPREHNLLSPLVDGQAAFSAMLEAIRGAKEYVYIVGWTLTPAFALDPSTPDGLLTSVLGDIAQRVPVKILVWSGSLMLFPPSKRLVTHVCSELKRIVPQVECRLDGRARPTHCHHQKAVIVDGQIGFVGGLDLTTLSGYRWDVPGHPLRLGPNWHDVMVQVQGEAVQDLETNFAQRWREVTGERHLPHVAPRVDPTWNTACQIVRTVPRGVYSFARGGEYGIAHGYLAAIAQAKRFVYIENQYIWSPEIVDALMAAMERRAGDHFRIVMVLPARAYMGKHDNDQHVQQLQAADRGRGMFSAYTIYSGGPAAGPDGFSFRPIYVHGKVAVVDDEWYTIGSANLNKRGLATDTEMNAQVIDPEGARALRTTLWSEHLGYTQEEIAAFDPIEVIDRIWPERAAQVKAVLDRRWGVLPAQAHPYEIGRMRGRWILQEIEASLVEGL
ncbi:MAG: phospholipase D-like domain-containing protein [Herpetosiphon sp.]